MRVRAVCYLYCYQKFRDEKDFRRFIRDHSSGGRRPCYLQITKQDLGYMRKAVTGFR